MICMKKVFRNLTDNDECYKTMIIKQFVIALSVLI